MTPQMVARDDMPSDTSTPKLLTPAAGDVTPIGSSIGSGPLAGPSADSPIGAPRLGLAAPLALLAESSRDEWPIVVSDDEIAWPVHTVHGLGEIVMALTFRRHYEAQCDDARVIRACRVIDAEHDLGEVLQPFPGVEFLRGDDNGDGAMLAIEAPTASGLLRAARVLRDAAVMLLSYQAGWSAADFAGPVTTDADRQWRLEAVTRQIARLLDVATALQVRPRSGETRDTARLAVATTSRDRQDAAERAAVDTLRVHVIAQHDATVAEWDTHSQARFLTARLDEIAGRLVSSTTALSIVMAFHRALATPRAIRRCRRCEAEVTGTDTLCEPCRQNRAALWLLRDPEMPTPEVRR